MSRRWRLLPDNKELSWTPYAWLTYLPTFLMEPIARTRAGEYTALHWTLTVLGLIAFLISYFYGYWARGNRVTAVAAFQTLLGIAFAPINVGSFVFFIYAGSFAAQLDNERRALQHIFAITLLAAATALWIEAPPFFWLGGVLITLIISAVNWHYARYSRTQRRLRRAEDEIHHLAAVAERERIARDLHDVLGHTLSLIVLKSELASRLAERDPQRAAREIADVEAVARKALQDVRETIRGFRPTLADEVVRAQSLLQAAGISSAVERSELSIDKGREETLAFALREGATNVARHSRATQCRIVVAQNNGTATLAIEDNGKAQQIVEGSGMRGMRERVEAYGGDVSYELNDGFKLRVTVPVPK
jgi:two-component system sensor histidine kinase DesK